MRALVQGRTLKDLVAEFIRQGLGMAPRLPLEPPASGSLIQVGPTGLPVIRCRADAPATRASLHDLLALEQLTQLEEDFQHAGRAV